ncbi:MAG: ABC transporter substrate-binding protein [Spirochaetales bacterium]
MKKFAFIAACVALCLVVVSCGGGQSESATKVVYWSMWSESEPQAIIIKDAAKSFEEETGIAIQIEFKGRNGIREGLEPALESGQTIDLFDEAIDRVVLTWGPYLLDIEDMAGDYVVNHANAGLVAAGRDYDTQGRLLVVPYQATTWVWWYNKDLFAKAGITSVPTTWAEFEAVCQKLVNAGITPITMDDAYATKNLGMHLSRYIGQDNILDLVNGTGTIKWNDPQVVAALKSFEEFAAKGYFSSFVATNVFPAGQNTEFGLGEVAMNANGAWLPNEIKGITGDNFNWGCFAYPTVPNGAEPITTNYLGCQAFGVNVNSKVPQEALDFAIYVSTGERDLAMSAAALTIPADSQNTEWPVQLAELREAFNSTTEGTLWASGIEMNTDLTPVIKDNTIKLMSGQITADQFVQILLNS